MTDERVFLFLLVGKFNDGRFLKMKKAPIKGASIAVLPLIR